MTDKELFEKTEKTFNLQQKNNIVNKVFNEGKFNNVLNEMKNSKSPRRRRSRRRWDDKPSGLSTAVNSAAEGIGGAAKGIGKGIGKVFSSLNPFSKQKKLNKQEEIDRVHQNRMDRLDLITKGQEMYTTGRSSDTQYSKDKIANKDKDLEFREKEYDFEQKKKANSASPGDQQPNQQQPEVKFKVGDEVLVRTKKNPKASGIVTKLLDKPGFVQVKVGNAPYAFDKRNVTLKRGINKENFEQIVKKYR